MGFFSPLVLFFFLFLGGVEVHTCSPLVNGPKSYGILCSSPAIHADRPMVPSSTEPVGDFFCRKLRRGSSLTLSGRGEEEKRAGGDKLMKLFRMLEGRLLLRGWLADRL